MMTQRERERAIAHAERLAREAWRVQRDIATRLYQRQASYLSWPPPPPELWRDATVRRLTRLHARCVTRVRRRTTRLSVLHAQTAAILEEEE